MKIENNLWVYPKKIFDIKDYYTILTGCQKDFDSYTNIILNEQFATECRWHCTVINDLETNQCRLYFRIEHSYCDGYNLIETLTFSFLPSYVKPKFKRSSLHILKGFYYYVIGTIILFLTNIHILWKIFFNKPQHKSKKSMVDFSKNEVININCGSLDFDKIKRITKKHNVTVNTFLYSLMVITWHNYTNAQPEPAITISPINVKREKSSSYNTNNMFFIFTEVKNKSDPIILLKTVDELFNLYKFSLYIPIVNNMVSFLFPFIPQVVLSKEIFSNIDITYSNMIGPDVPEKENILKIKKAQFSTATQQNEICFNIISFKNKININISSRKGVIVDTNKFIQSFENAYEDLLSI